MAYLHFKYMAPNISKGIYYTNFMKGLEPLRCVTLNTIIPLGIVILRNATHQDIETGNVGTQHHREP